MSRAMLLRVALLALALTTLAGCVPAIVVGVAATAMVATDRRSAGAQVDDEAIELKVATKIGGDYETRVHVSILFQGTPSSFS